MAPLTRLTTQLMLSYATTKLGFEKQCHDNPKSVSPPLTEYGGYALSTTSWGFNRMDVYGVAEGGGIAHQYWDGYQWGPSYNTTEILGGKDDYRPTAVSPGEGRMDLFQVVKDGTLMHKYYDGKAWRPDATSFESLGDDLDPSSVLAVTVNGSNPIDVFGRSDKGDKIYHKYWDGTAWQPEEHMEDLGDGTTQLVHGPTAVSWGRNRTDIFALDDEHKPKHQYWDGTTWLKKWESLGDASLTHSPTAISWGTNRLDLFSADSDSGSLLHCYWDGSQWSTWEDLGTPSADVQIARYSTVAATSWSENRTDIVVQGTDGAYYYKYWDGSQWQPSVKDFIPKGGEFDSSPEVVSWGENRLDIYGVGTDKVLKHITWYGNGWYPSATKFEDLGRPLKTVK